MEDVQVAVSHHPFPGVGADLVFNPCVLALQVACFLGSFPGFCRKTRPQLLFLPEAGIT